MGNPSILLPLLCTIALWARSAHVAAHKAVEPAAQQVETTPFTDDELSGIGEVSSSITASAAAGVDSNKMNLNKNHAGAIMKGLESIPPPDAATIDMITKPQNAYDPDILSRIDACERDYSQPCPELYNLVGDPKGDGSILCANPEPNDKCSTVNIKGKTDASKAQWALRCVKNWPCKVCSRDYGKQCPENWRPWKGSFTACESTSAYRGPCSGVIMDFLGMNTPMKERWSQVCTAWWPCQTDLGTAEDVGPSPDFPLSSDATNWRMLRGYQ